MRENGNAPSSSYKIGLAGCGKMGSAMVQAWLAQGLVAQIDILDPNEVPENFKSEKTITAFTNETSFGKGAGDWDILIIAVKPQTMAAFCGAMKAYLPEGMPVLSIAAGQTVSGIEEKIGQRPVIRAMPNTPAAIGKGISVLCGNAQVTSQHKIVADALMGALGLAAWVADEASMDAVTGLSGSGPAYVFYLIEAMAEAGAAAGLEPDFAMMLARQTVIGSAALAESEPDITAATLRENVTSPNGTTAAGLSVLMDGRFQEIVSAAIKKAADRSRELSK